MVGFRSGQTGQTVNLLATPSKVRILIPPPLTKSPAIQKVAGLFLLIINELQKVVIVPSLLSPKIVSEPVSHRLCLSEGSKGYNKGYNFCPV